MKIDTVDGRVAPAPPDGSPFLSAGRLDFANHPGELFILTPDRGRSGDVAAFCSALAPR